MDVPRSIGASPPPVLLSPPAAPALPAAPATPALPAVTPRGERWSAFTKAFLPWVGNNLLLRVGAPAIGASTPLIIHAFGGGEDHSLWAEAAVGAGLGGAWGAAVGALIPTVPVGEPHRRLKSVGKSAAAGLLLAPAVGAVSQLLGDRLASPLQDDRPSPTR